jgi:hypothetical protein
MFAICHIDGSTGSCKELASWHFFLADLHPIDTCSHSCFDLGQYVRARFGESQRLAVRHVTRNGLHSAIISHD